MAFLDFLLGKPEQMQQVSTLTPQQQSAQQQMLGGAQDQFPQMMQFLQQILGNSPELMNQFQAPAMRQFQENILPTIAERFSGMGAQKSSAFGQQLGQAGAGLAENLSAQQAGMKSNAVSQLQSLLGQGMNPTFENVMRPATSGALGGLLGGLGSGLGQAGGMAGMMKLLPMLGLGGK